MKQFHNKIIFFIVVSLLLTASISPSQNYLGGEINFSPAEGNYSTPLKVKIGVKPFMYFFGKKIETKVYYTIDGSIPNELSQVYSSEILLNGQGNITVRARAISIDKKVLGKIYSAKYILRDRDQESEVRQGEFAVAKREQPGLSKKPGGKSEVDLSPRFASPLDKGGQGGSDSNIQNSSHKKYEGKKDEYSAVFGGDAYLSEVLLFDMGCLVLKFTHPLSHHRDTIMKDKIKSGNGDVKVIFDTEYRSWRKGHHMVWSIVFNKYRIPKDIKFISDSGTFKTGSFYNRIKSNIMNGLKEIAGKIRNDR